MRSAALLVAAVLAFPSASAAHGYVRGGAAYEGGGGAGAAFDLGLGERLAPHLRGEVQAAWRPGLAPGPGGDRVSLLAIAYADLGMFGRAQPYLGLGAGAALAPGSGRTAFAWKAEAGVGWLLSSRLTLDLALRYADQGEAHTAGSRTRLATRGIGASLRRRF